MEGIKAAVTINKMGIRIKTAAAKRISFAMRPGTGEEKRRDKGKALMVPS
jgi:hypothetical protein